MIDSVTKQILSSNKCLALIMFVIIVIVKTIMYHDFTEKIEC